MKVFFDFEFTGLHKHTTPISLGCVAEDGRTFYAEFTDYDRSQVDDWLRANVIANLKFTNKGGVSRLSWQMNNSGGFNIEGYAKKNKVAEYLLSWLQKLGDAQMWGDCLAYDWVLFCDLFGGAMQIPKNVYYQPFDLVTLLEVAGVDPDISREQFSNIGGAKHNALHDAKVIKGCFERCRHILWDWHTLDIS